MATRMYMPYMSATEILIMTNTIDHYTRLHWNGGWTTYPCILAFLSLRATLKVIPH